MVSAYLLVTHGSRDPRPQEGAEQLAKFVLQHQREQVPTAVSSPGGELPQTETIVETATLELADIPLHEKIAHFAQTAYDAGILELQILPLFLLPGVHVKEDIPAEVCQAQENLGAKITLKLHPHLGSYPGISALIAPQFAQIPAEGRILLSHGSRRPQGNTPIEAIAEELGAVAAYWSVSPSLRDRVFQLLQKGFNSITIVPYFLFPGGITEAISQEVQQLQKEYPEQQIQLGQPLGATPQLADLIINGMTV